MCVCSGSILTMYMCMCIPNDVCKQGEVHGIPSRESLKMVPLKL